MAIADTESRVLSPEERDRLRLRCLVDGADRTAAALEVHVITLLRGVAGLPLRVESLRALRAASEAKAA